MPGSNEHIGKPDTLDSFTYVSWFSRKIPVKVGAGNRVPVSPHMPDKPPECKGFSS